MPDNENYSTSDAAKELETLFADAVDADNEPVTGEEEELEFASDDSTEADMAPDEDQTSQDDEAEDEPAEPTIAPPRSWSADEQAAFNNLPRDIQQIITNRETERDNATKHTLNQTAENRKAYEAELTRMQAAQEQNLQNIYALTAAILPDLQELDKTNWNELASYDSQEWARRKQLQSDLVDKFNGLKYQHNQLVAQQQTQHQALVNQRINEQLLVAYEAIPEFNFVQDGNGNGSFKDPVKAQALNNAMQKTFQDYGFTDNDAPMLYSDARTVKALARLSQLEQREAARTTAMAKKQAPQVSRLSAPSSSAPTANNGKGSRGYKASMERLSKSGNARDAAAALEHLLQ